MRISSIILKAAGRAFSAGYDISPGTHGDGSDDLYTELMRFRKTNTQWGKLWNLSKPIVAQVHGYCLAGATDLATNCDMIIAAENATFGLPDVRGIESVENHMWTYLVGPQWAKRMMMTGDPIDGKTAERIGLIMQAVPADQLESEARRLAERMANIPLELLAPHKSLINKVMGLMGHAVAQQMAFDTVSITHYSHARRNFSETAEKEGLPSRPPQARRPIRRLHGTPEEVRPYQHPFPSQSGKKYRRCKASPVFKFLFPGEGRSC